MKKILLLASTFFAASVSYAGEKGLTQLQKEKEMLVGKTIISKGFYLNLGVSFPSASITPTRLDFGGSSITTGIPSNFVPTLAFGPQFNFEIGNQWYFWKNEKMGVGLRVSWLQFGFGGLTSKFPGSPDQIVGSNIDLRLFKLAPQFTYAFNDKMALDFSFEVSPTFLIGAGTVTSVNNGTTVLAYASPGLLFAPGVKFRYSVFAAGVDFGFGSPLIGQVYTNGSTTLGVTGNGNFFMPRLYIGFKF